MGTLHRRIILTLLCLLCLRLSDTAHTTNNDSLTLRQIISTKNKTEMITHDDDYDYHEEDEDLDEEEEDLEQDFVEMNFTLPDGQFVKAMSTPDKLIFYFPQVNGDYAQDPNWTMPSFVGSEDNSIWDETDNEFTEPLEQDDRTGRSYSRWKGDRCIVYKGDRPLPNVMGLARSYYRPNDDSQRLENIMADVISRLHDTSDVGQYMFSNSYGGNNGRPYDGMAEDYPYYYDDHMEPEYSKNDNDGVGYQPSYREDYEEQDRVPGNNEHRPNRPYPPNYGQQYGYPDGNGQNNHKPNNYGNSNYYPTDYYTASTLGNETSGNATVSTTNGGLGTSLVFTVSSDGSSSQPVVTAEKPPEDNPENVTGTSSTYSISSSLDLTTNVQSSTSLNATQSTTIASQFTEESTLGTTTAKATQSTTTIQTTAITTGGVKSGISIGSTNSRTTGPLNATSAAVSEPFEGELDTGNGPVPVNQRNFEVSSAVTVENVTTVEPVSETTFTMGIKVIKGRAYGDEEQQPASAMIEESSSPLPPTLAEQSDVPTDESTTGLTSADLTEDPLIVSDNGTNSGTVNDTQSSTTYSWVDPPTFPIMDRSGGKFAAETTNDTAMNETLSRSGDNANETFGADILSAVIDHFYEIAKANSSMQPNATFNNTDEMHGRAGYDSEDYPTQTTVTYSKEYTYTNVTSYYTTSTYSTSNTTEYSNYTSQSDNYEISSSVLIDTMATVNDSFSISNSSDHLGRGYQEEVEVDADANANSTTLTDVDATTVDVQTAIVIDGDGIDNGTDNGTTIAPVVSVSSLNGTDIFTNETMLPKNSEVSELEDAETENKIIINVSVSEDQIYVDGKPIDEHKLCRDFVKFLMQQFKAPSSYLEREENDTGNERQYYQKTSGVMAVSTQANPAYRSLDMGTDVVNEDSSVSPYPEDDDDKDRQYGKRTSGVMAASTEGQAYRVGMDNYRYTTEYGYYRSTTANATEDGRYYEKRTSGVKAISTAPPQPPPAPVYRAMGDKFDYYTSSTGLVYYTTTTEPPYTVGGYRQYGGHGGNGDDSSAGSDPDAHVRAYYDKLTSGVMAVSTGNPIIYRAMDTATANDTQPGTDATEVSRQRNYEPPNGQLPDVREADEDDVEEEEESASTTSINSHMTRRNAGNFGDSGYKYYTECETFKDCDALLNERCVDGLCKCGRGFVPDSFGQCKPLSLFYGRKDFEPMGVIAKEAASGTQGAKRNDPCENEESNYCSPYAVCVSEPGRPGKGGRASSYSCVCKEGYADESPNSAYPGEVCRGVCSEVFCNNRGSCHITNFGDLQCRCDSWYVGTRCESDGLSILFGVIGGLLAVVAVSLIICCLQKNSINRRWNPLRAT